MMEIYQKRISILVIVLFTIMASINVQAQQVDKKDLTLEKIFNSNEFKAKKFGPVKWLADGSAYTTLERSKKIEGNDLVKYNPETGEREVIVSAINLVPGGTNEALYIKDYSWFR